MKRRLFILGGSAAAAVVLMGSFAAGYLSQGSVVRAAPEPTAVPAAPTAVPTLPPETVAPEPTVPETEPWLLEPPADIPGGEKQLPVSYRQVHETVYAAYTLYVRSGPGTEFPVIGSLSKGDPVRRGAVGDNGWSQILFEDREAYVNTMNLSVTPVSPESEIPDSVILRPVEDLVRAVDTTKIRTGPGYDYPVIGHMVKGSGARRNAICSNGWSQVFFHDTVGYTNTAFLYSDSEAASPRYYEEAATVYAADTVNIRTGPGTGYEVLGQAHTGDRLQQTAVGEDGWTRIRYEDQDAYLCTAFLTGNPGGTGATVVSSPRERPTPNSPFYFEYQAPEDVMPYALFTPVNAEEGKPLPLFISLHGALEIGESPETLESNFLTREFRNWEYTGLQGFDAYIVCPQLTGLGFSTTWSCEKTADDLFALIEHLKQTCNVDADRISLEGHSLGAQGALYMALDSRAQFSAVVLVSAYDPLVPRHPLDCAIRGYNGSPYISAPREDWTSYNFMQKIFTEEYGAENWITKNCSHYAIPMVALEEDSDGDGRSDFMTWVLAQSRNP